MASVLPGCLRARTGIWSSNKPRDRAARNNLREKQIRAPASREALMAGEGELVSGSGAY